VAVNLPELGELLEIPGITIGTAIAGIKQSERDDLVVLVLAPGTQAAGVFTQNAFRAAPVEIAVDHLVARAPRALVINSGNANAATGGPGYQDALDVCAGVAQVLDIEPTQVLPFSTGVIGERLPVAAMLGAVARAGAATDASHWEAAANAILTTDTRAKALSRRLEVQDVEVKVTGIAKGAGMIRPDMATMLAFVGCDANIDAHCLQAMARRVAERSFNRITVDGDTSTNDAFVIIATGAAGNPPISGPRDAGYEEVLGVLTEVAAELAQRIVRDGEGASRFVSIRVAGGASADECLAVAYTVAESPLVKTAMFAGDPNWGRFCMAIGRAGIPGLDPARVNLFLDDVCVARAGLMDEAYREAAGSAVMAREEYEILIELGRGDAEEVVWTTDLSYEYVRINAEYRT
jgi:glutamate N-acetyltransferase/amino-acid N-acetyltransferase